MSIGVVGKDTDFVILGEKETQVFLSQIEGDDKRTRPAEDVVSDDRPPQDPPADQGPRGPTAAVATEEHRPMDTE